MKTLVYEIIGVLLVFLLIKLVYVLICKLINWGLRKKFTKMQVEEKEKFDLSISIMLEVSVVVSIFAAIFLVNILCEVGILELYISFYLIGISSVIWCYFSWDSEKIFTKPHIATVSECKRKKIIVYISICAYVFVQGYYQSCKSMGLELKILNDLEPIFSIINYSVIAGIIALDRVFNQIIKPKEK